MDWSRVYALSLSAIALIVVSLYIFSFAFNAHTTGLLLLGIGGLVVMIPIVVTLVVKVIREFE